MPLNVSRLQMWAAEVEDQPGALARALGELSEAGANFEFVLARRSPEQPGRGVVFVTPVQGPAQARAARKAGFEKTQDLYALRIEGPDRRSLCANLAHELAASGLNLRGMSASAIGRRCIMHVAFDSAAEASKAARVLKGL